MGKFCNLGGYFSPDSNSEGYKALERISTPDWDTVE